MEVFDETKHEVYYFSKEVNDRISFMSMHVNRESNIVAKTNHPGGQHFIGRSAKAVFNIMEREGFTLSIL
jgi:hypothetical protein